MRAIFHSPVLGGVAILATAVVVAEGWLLLEAHGALRTAALEMARGEREWRRLAALTPAPTEEQAAAIATDLARAEGELEALQAAAWDRDATAGLLAAAIKAPESRAEAFFDLAEFVRRMRKLADGTGAIVAAGEQFGFSAYGHAGPETELIAPILRQRQIAGYLLESLFGSRIRQLLAVQRASPAQGKPGTAGAALNADGDARVRADLFEIDPGLSLRVPEMVETTAFRLTFLGHTAALRGFLNRLALGGIPVVVRSVEVEPARETAAPRQAVAASTDPLELIVRPAWSRFTVTVEFCDVKVGPVEAGRRSAPPSPPIPESARRRWPDPSAQRRGRGWVFDVFTPPALYYDRCAASVSAIPVAEIAPPDSADPEIDLKLLDVHRSPFRLQLVGYAGEPENLRGIFLQPATGETMILHGGERSAAQGLTVKRIDFARPGTGPKDDTSRDVVARAIVLDESTGEDVTLSDREPCLAGAPLGVFTSHKTPGFRRELREGESVALNGCNYCVTHIDLQPPQVVIACLMPGTTEPRLRTLAPSLATPAVERTAPPRAADKNGKSAARNP